MFKSKFKLMIIFIFTFFIINTKILIAETAYYFLISNKIISKIENENITRLEFFVSLSNILFHGQYKNENIIFTDLEGISEIDKNKILLLAENKILEGENIEGKNYLKPNDFITREDAVSYIYKGLNLENNTYKSFKDEIDINNEYKDFFYACYNEKLIKDENGYIYPKNFLNKNEFVDMIYNAYFYNNVKKSDLNNEKELTTYFGLGLVGSNNGTPSKTRFSLPRGITIDLSNNIIVFDTNNNLIKKLDGVESKNIVGRIKNYDEYGFPKGYYIDGTLKEAFLNRPTNGVFINRDLFFTDSGSNAVRFVRENKVYTFSGGLNGYQDGDRKIAKFNAPIGIAKDIENDLYIADTGNHAIRKIDKNGKTNTVSGIGKKSGYKDGPTKTALFNEPMGIAIDSNGTIYVADTGNHVIRKIEDGKVSTFAGVKSTDMGGFFDGNVEEALFSFPQGLLFVNDYLLVADTGNNRIRAISKEGEVITVVGNEPGDIDGEISIGRLYKPTSMIYKNKKLYIVDSGNNKIKTLPLDFNDFKKEQNNK